MTTVAVRSDMKHAIVPAPLQTFISEPTAVTGTTHLPNEQSLARQILHNLQYQHYWTDLQVHTHSPLTDKPLPRPLVSGLSPQRLYVHPDEQVELLKKADRERKARAADEAGGLEVKPEPEREWILPTRLNETCSTPSAWFHRRQTRLPRQRTAQPTLGGQQSVCYSRQSARTAPSSTTSCTMGLLSLARTDQP
jgi:hypothetical protein